MSKFKVGNKVTIVKGSEYEDRGNANPKNGVVGEVIKIYKESSLKFHTKVEWPFGYKNVYSDEDLELVVENKLEVGKTYKCKDGVERICIGYHLDRYYLVNYNMGGVPHLYSSDGLHKGSSFLDAVFTETKTVLGRFLVDDVFYDVNFEVTFEGGEPDFSTIKYKGE